MIVDKILSCTDNELTIRVFDSTGFPHINDTRKNTTGIGSGNVVLFKNETGRWGCLSTKQFIQALRIS